MGRGGNYRDIFRSVPHCPDQTQSPAPSPGPTTSLDQGNQSKGKRIEALKAFIHENTRVQGGWLLVTSSKALVKQPQAGAPPGRG